MDQDVILKRFETPDEVREFPFGKFEIVHIHGMTIGRATYQPGWKWSEHVGNRSGRPIARSSMSGWSFQAAPLLRWLTA